MKQVLSQQEIDSLLNALNTGEINPEEIKEEEEKNKVRAYDFRRPIKLSKEYINTLYMIFENFAKISSNVLSNQVRTNINLTLGAVEQISFDEFVHSIPNPTIMGIFHSAPLSGNQILEINPQFAIQVIELLCGGAESKEKKGFKKDKFTDIELGIIEDIVVNILKGFKSAWNEILELDPVLDSLDTNPQLVQTMSPNEPVVLISFGVEIFGQKSFINICIPYVSFENITDKLSIRSWFDMGKTYDDSKYKEQISERLVSTEVNLTVEMGKTILTVDDFLHLEPGDIVQLDMRTDKPMKMYVEDKVHYLVQPGLHKDKLAVQVLQYVEEDVEI
ncbi:flagellar motor switch protein FliM [Alkalibacter mobilis]|uniref:flagellar motor switch protein FliM n=1 Tax=Alkalibacter mobilis TaxID=2787712 RepID=UPI00189E8E27|nr:flagellar motor switch protein FliM [Alkalibacter mobilis]MBF7096339.1 flagellar motor switch protein FliM [Alkalibacter mobilis]